MIELLKSVLEECNVATYKIVEEKVESAELFFIKKDLDLSRGKDIINYTLTVYKDFEEKGKRYRGSSEVTIFRTMRNEQIKVIVNAAMYAANFIKNEYYNLPKGHKEGNIVIPNGFSNNTIEDAAFIIKDMLYNKDEFEKGFINSSEIFVYKVNKRIINSEGIDVSYEKIYSDVEFITQWIESQDVELYNYICFTELDKDYIDDKVIRGLNKTKFRDKAKDKLPSGKYKVILCEDEVRELIDGYYVNGAKASSIYNKTSNFKINEKLQGEDIKGDYLNISLKAFLSNSKTSVPYDNDGIKLNDLELISNGVLKNYYGNSRFCQYLNIEPTGDIPNVIVKCGNKSMDEMEREIGLLVLAFSSFEIDEVTGDFAGEIRLGLYNDGEKITPITGGSISANIKDVQDKIYLSSDIYKTTSYEGPIAVQICDVSVAGE